MRHKFELALQDVQRLRERVAELEDDLSRRPAADSADSAELVSLRAERDGLSQRLEELEARPQTQLDPDFEQHLADLQRRFELAVEDVRELKTKNAKLESQLASANANANANRASAPDDGGSMDWESQKRRLLASLADEGERHDDSARQQERTTIQNTIEMTDAIVAEKDRRLAQLAAELEAAHNNQGQRADGHSQAIHEIIDADEVIAQHRHRARELEREMEEKLRAAELEVSVERAKLARKSRLEELRDTLESQRQLLESNGATPAPAPGEPRRRWLSKLGIDGKE